VIDAAHFGSNGGKEINPTVQELLENWEQFERRIKRMHANYVVAFGSNVKSAFAVVDKTEYIDFRVYKRGKQELVFSPHPSFIMVYRRKEMHKYISSLSSVIFEHATSPS
jgi:hypothetical protein